MDFSKVSDWPQLQGRLQQVEAAPGEVLRVVRRGRDEGDAHQKVGHHLRHPRVQRVRVALAQLQERILGGEAQRRGLRFLFCFVTKSNNHEQRKGRL